MKKLILFIMILFVQVSFAQRFEIKDSIVAHARAMEQHAQSILRMTESIENLEDQTGTADLSAIEATLLLHRAILDSLGVLIQAGISPFPSAPTNLIATDTAINSVTLDWAYTGTTPDSYAVYVVAGGLSTTTPYLYCVDSDTVVNGLYSSTNYNIWVKAVIGTQYSGSSNILNITTLDTVVTDPISTDLGDYFVDYATGSEENTGLTTGAPLKYSPDDPLSTSGIALVSGDTVVFKRGITYYGQIEATTGVTYRSDYRWGGSVKAKFDLQNTREYAFYVGANDNINIESIEIFGAKNSGTRYAIHLTSGSNNVTVDSCTIALLQGWSLTGIGQMVSRYGVYLPGGVTNFTLQNSEMFGYGRYAIGVLNSDYINILNNDFGGINRGDSTGYLSVCILGQGSATNIYITGNTFHDAWHYGQDLGTNETNHAPDLIHVYETSGGQPSYWYVEKNLFYNDKVFALGSGTGNMSFSTNAHHIYIRNNLLVNSCQWWGANISLSYGANNIHVENNTFVDRSYSDPLSTLWVHNLSIYLTTDASRVGDSIFVRNNIFWNDDNHASTVNIRLKVGQTLTTGSVIDYNAYLNANTYVASTNGSSRTFSYWQGLGNDVNGAYYTTTAGNGYFINMPASGLTSSSGNYALSSSATTFLKTGGLTISGFTDDYNGATRTSGWSIGAIEYVP